MTAPSSTGAERRREPRRPAEGKAVVQLNRGRTIYAEMVDVSSSGFRIRYRGNPVEAGEDVEISYPWGEVRASIIWVRTEKSGWTEVGFLILR